MALDGARTLGAKILVAGGGRCNVTHHAVDESAYAGSSRHAIKKVLRAFEQIRRGGHPDHPVFRGPQDATYDLACLLRDDEGWLGREAGQDHPLPLGLGIGLTFGAKTGSGNCEVRTAPSRTSL